MREDAERWLRQAEADLRMAVVSTNSEGYEWACFQAQQAAEKAIKAFLYDKGYTSVMTHSLTELVAECEKVGVSFQEVASEAHFLDQFYVLTRYPNGLAGHLTPSEFYQRSDAEQCVSSSESILRVVKRLLGR